MLNIALFISGRSLGYKDCLLPFVNNHKIKYNLILFFSINSTSLDKQETVESVTADLKNTFGGNIGDIYFEEYKLPKKFVANRLNNNINNFPYNILSNNYNDGKNMELIEMYEANNKIVFDIICKTRSDIFFWNNVDFIVDNENDLVIRNKHMDDAVRHWGHLYNDTPLMISDAFAYGNKKSMHYYCSTHDWVLKSDLLLNGNYIHANEIYVTDSILQTIFYDTPGGGTTPRFSKEEILNKYMKNPNGIKIVYLNNVNYGLMRSELRKKNNFIVYNQNVHKYTHN